MIVTRPNPALIRSCNARITPFSTLRIQVQVNGLFEHNDGVDDYLTGSVPGCRTRAINVDCLVVEAALKRIRLHVVRWIRANFWVAK